MNGSELVWMASKPHIVRQADFVQVVVLVHIRSVSDIAADSAKHEENARWLWCKFLRCNARVVESTVSCARTIARISSYLQHISTETQKELLL